MPFFTDWLSRQQEMGQRVVIDATGLKGSYDFQLNWKPDESINGPDAGAQSTNAPLSNSSTPSIFTALQEQLGLKVEPRKAPVEVLVLDHVEQPSEN